MRSGKDRVKGELMYILLEYLRGRYDCESGVTVGELARVLYGEDNKLNRDRVRSLISKVRKVLNAHGVRLYSLPCDGGIRRYFILGKPEDFERVLNDVEVVYRRRKSLMETIVETADPASVLIKVSECVNTILQLLSISNETENWLVQVASAASEKGAQIADTLKRAGQVLTRLAELIQEKH